MTQRGGSHFCRPPVPSIDRLLANPPGDSATERYIAACRRARAKIRRVEVRYPERADNRRMTERPLRRRRAPTEILVEMGRLKALSDSVVAFALTLLVLDIRIPAEALDADL